ncbi:hypothetical protein U8527_10405 [Kordia algicida OT-1]|uniref:Uncharacterized protein n=1 Tax=Kordia algicida OT-1 TaxID=391587 RepID=A9DW67_9FLAO|nr:hypothetical protein [Kordia algicida]EDP96517.1 hypothetical protein KAOT1_03872 [Kordia algicida OT-1]
MTIEALQAVDLEKIAYPTIKEYAQEILQDYADEDDKNKEEAALQAKESIEAVYKMIQLNSPEAIPGNESEQESSDKDQDKAGHTPKKKKKLTKKELDAFEEEIKHCRTAIKAYNAKKREGQPKKPTPKRHEKIEKHLMAIGNLVPENLKDNLDILEASEKILSKTGREIMKLYRMDELQIKEVQEEIKEKYDQKEQKIKKDNDE